MRVLEIEGAPNTCGPGPYVVDWSNPITNGLTYVNVLNDLSGIPIYAQKAIGTVSMGSTTTFSTTGLGGVGLGGSGNDSGIKYASSGIDFSLVAGTAMVYSTISFNQSESTNRIWFDVRNGGNAYQLFHQGGINYYGWFTGVEYRVSPSAFNSGTQVMGGTYCNNAALSTVGSAVWFNGIKRGFNSTSPVPASMAGGTWSIGFYTGGVGLSIFQSPGGNVIHWIAFWDRVLNDSEIVYLNANPMCFLVPIGEYEMPVAASIPTGPAPTLFARASL